MIKKNVSDGEAPILDNWRVWSTYSFPLLVGLCWSGVVVPVSVPSIGKNDLFEIIRVR